MVDSSQIDERSEVAAPTVWRHWRTIAIVCIVLAGLTMRWRNHDKMSVWYDEGFSFVLTQQPWDRMMSIIRADDHPPLYYFLLRPWLRASGAQYPPALEPPRDADLAQDAGIRYVAWGRKLSILLGMLALIPGWWLARDFVGRGGAMAFLTLMAFSPYLIHYSQEVRMYALLMALSGWAWLATWRLRERWDARWAAVWVVAITAMMYTHYFSIAAVMGQFFCLAAWRWRQTGRIGATLLALALLGMGSFALYGHWLTWFFTQLMNNTAGGINTSATQTLSHKLQFYLHPILFRIAHLPFEPLVPGGAGVSSYAKNVFALALCLGCVGHAAWVARRDPLKRLFLIWGLGFPLAFTLFYQFGMQGRVFGRLLIVFWIPFFLVVCDGLRTLWEAEGARRWIGGGVFVWLALSFVSSWWPLSTDDERGVARFAYSMAIRHQPELPVYHATQLSLFPLMAYERQHPRHQYLLVGRQSYITARLAGRDRWVRPSARERIQTPCMLIVYEEVYINDPRARAIEQQRLVDRYLQMFFPDVAPERVQSVDFGNRKWARALLVE